MAVERARELLNGRSLVFSLNQGQAARWDEEAFRRFVALAAEFGATHVRIGELPFRYGNWVLPDNTDPYAAWCNCSPSILRVCPPEEIRPWVTVGEARRCQALLGRQLAVLRAHGLRAVVNAVEPLWLPEGVFRAHPRWRGPHCELGRIALQPYFCPSIDEPEVLDLYRRAMREFSTLFPEVDEFAFLSNDSGGGIAWTPNIYPGINGPVRWRTRDGGERIAGWLKALKDGAAEAGARVRFNLMSSGLPAELTTSARAKLEPGLFVNSGNDHGEAWGGPGAHLAAGLWSVAYPVPGLGDPAAFMAGLLSVYHNPSGDAARCGVGFGVEDIETARMALETCLAEPGPGLERRARLLVRLAGRVAGSPEAAEALAGAWEAIAAALHGIAQVRQKGFGLVLPFCGVSMRWILRPLVAEPEKLTPAETAHYRDFLFSPGGAKDDPNPGLVLGKAVFNGESVTWMARWCLHEAIGRLQGARVSLARLAEQAADPEAAARLRMAADRAGAVACFARNARNTIMFKYALDVRRQPQYGPNPMDYDDNMICDQRALTMRKIAREELDNITELIELVEAHGRSVVHFAAAPEEESVFVLGPNLAADLRRKLDVMLDHWQDYERLYPTTKVWDFEPEPRGNTVPPQSGG
jgi:hypothetical protein